MPFVRDHLDLKRYMSIVILALLPVTFSGYTIPDIRPGIGPGNLGP